ncbi:HAD family phosphatase [Euzebyella marina]|uniref:HAD family phosphatase n=1 Tax=Euzebyella marina TaxID=1761453 RepID=A0A3G2L6H0_9FLAO|nr:HAD family phosphatase [Euzebyella marina]AYN67874.1 HAD family phosphatase [Euzebyella marina]
MIKNIIFDFGDVFINLDKQIVYREMQRLGGSTQMTPELLELNNLYEVGQISTDQFLEGLSIVYPHASEIEIKEVWNGMLLDFPDERLEFVEAMAKKSEYRLFLLSNTNALHIEHVEQKMGHEKFNRFRNSFEKFYLSHEINLRKPNEDIYRFVLDQNELKAEETFFIDDTKENTDAASNMGIKCWNLLVGQENLLDLNSRL